tara:strand:+ start:309 stop:1280 length:972 start_codon:yes stop_codon:yes gene_type:complete
MSKNIFISGHNGMVGSSIKRRIEKDYPHYNLILRSKKELNLLNQADVNDFFTSNKIDAIYFAAAKVGGILANSSHPYEFLYENMTIQSNLINAAIKNNIKKILFLGSSCIYPKTSKQPIKEEYLLSGHLEDTNEAYALAKISGIKLCESANIEFGLDYRCLMPTNLYGPGDIFDLEKSHVLPALIRKFVEAKEMNKKEVILWGSGKPRREFLHVDDLASAALYFMEMPKEEFWKNNMNKFSQVNIGTGKDIPIIELADLISNLVKYNGSIKLDMEKPDGMSQKLLDISKASNLGWNATISLEDGLKNTINWFIKNKDSDLIRK